ncbi:hypothetical protein DSO57_1002414 [Entomophthora muscae]|uniref:Uncharacterized protein n=1 Tax=Entomophthora muscae TaxID=34485 RepID=A0ACC2SAJ9_9FUNG|nr:hypothetical protein DSO57_1002414 [Entomophthora muscae]
MAPYRGNRKTSEGMKQILLITLASCVLGLAQELVTSPRITTVSVLDEEFVTKCKDLCSHSLSSCKPGFRFLCESTCEATATKTGGKQIIKNPCTPKMQMEVDCDMTQVDTTISSCKAHAKVLFPQSKNCKDFLCKHEEYFKEPSCLESACNDEGKMLTWVKAGSKDPQHQACFEHKCQDPSKSELCANFKLNTLFSCLDYRETQRLEKQLAEANKISKEKDNTVQDLKTKMQEITLALKKAEDEAKVAKGALDAANESLSKNTKNKNICQGDLTTYKDYYLADKLENCNKDLADKEKKAKLASKALSQKLSELDIHIKGLEIKYLNEDPNCDTELKRNGDIAFLEYKSEHTQSLEVDVRELKKANETAYDELAYSKECEHRVDQSFVDLADQAKQRYLPQKTEPMAQEQPEPQTSTFIAWQ